MLGKIIKYEFRSTWKTFAFLYGIAVVFLILVSMYFNFKDMGFENETFMIIFTIAVSLFSFAMFGIGVLTISYLCKRFFETVYGRQGYLTLTLPAKRSTILNGKLIVTSIWSVITTVVLFIFVFIYSSLITSIDFSEIWEAFLDVIDHIEPVSLISIIVTFLFNLVNLYLFIFAAISIGQLSNNNKKGMAILAGVGLKILGGVASAIGMALYIGITGEADMGLAQSFLSILAVFSIFFGENYDIVNYFAIIEAIVAFAFQYGICVWIMSRKANLQ